MTPPPLRYATALPPCVPPRSVQRTCNVELKILEKFNWSVQGSKMILDNFTGLMEMSPKQVSLFAILEDQDQAALWEKLGLLSDQGF